MEAKLEPSWDKNLTKLEVEPKSHQHRAKIGQHRAKIGQLGPKMRKLFGQSGEKAAGQWAVLKDFDRS